MHLACCDLPRKNGRIEKLLEDVLAEGLVLYCLGEVVVPSLLDEGRVNKAGANVPEKMKNQEPLILFEYILSYHKRNAHFIAECFNDVVLNGIVHHRVY